MNTHSYLHPVRLGLNLLRIASILFLLLSAFGPAYVTPVYADKLVCGIPGRDGPATLSGIVNTYYPGTADVAAGSTSIPVGGPVGGGPAIAAGDLLLVIQMQGADINSTNTDAYGDGVAGGAASGSLAANRTAGQYEYVVATSGVAGGFVSISSGLVNSYDFENFGAQGQRRFQVIRVPQNSSATISGTVNALPWNGSVGGVVAIDVAGTLTFSGGTVNASEQGFRGGGGVTLTGAVGPTNTDVRTLSTVAVNGVKGEGIAGTPRFIFNGTAVVDLTVEGYPNGTNARGAPGNAGGGSTDGNPAQNDENSGGGGGGNGGAGGLGGNTWQSNLSRGGYGGSPFAANPTHLVLGGGGGGGSINNQNDPVLSSGGAGGGIVMIRAGTVAGNGTINSNGADGQDQPGNESGGGAGAGGSVLVVAQNPLPAGLNVSANGGDGGDAWPTQPEITTPPPQNWRHGPGGGGGGGVVFLSSPVGTTTVAGGQHGLTTLSNDTYGSVDGSPGVTGTSTPASITTGISGAGCIPTPVVVKTTSTPVVTQTPTGTTGTYTINVSIPANQGTALGVTINDVLPTGFTYASTTLPIVLGGGATRVSVADPGVGAPTPSWGTFQIPGGGSVQITFTVNIASTVAPGVYDNPANATYLDPTRTTPNGETTSEYDHIPNDGEDIEVIGTTALSDLTVTKVNDAGGSVQPGSSFNWTIEVSNLGPGAVAFTGGNVIMNDALPGVAGYYPQGPLTVTNGPTPPSSTPTCTITGTALSCVANGTTTLPVNGSFSVTFAVTPTAGGDLANTAVVDPNGIITETNEGNNTATDTVSVLGADLSIVKTDGQASYAAGSVVTYTVTVRNEGGANITGATVSDARPANVATWAWACTSVTNGAANCTPAANSAADFSDTIDLPVDGTIIYTVTANIVASPTGDLVNTATIAVPPGYVDTNPGNNTSTDTDTLTTTSVDLAITKDDGQTGYAAGGTVIYTVTVQNLSAIAVSNAVVSDPIPANVASWSWACTGGNATCTPAASSSSNFTDTVDLPANGSIEYTVTAIVVASPTGDLVNTATVTPPPGVSDSNTGNNTSTDTDSLLAADLAITKTDTPRTTYLGGDTITYTVTVVNLSQTVDVLGATVSDPIPANIASWTWACTSGNGSGCTPAASSSANFTDTVDLPAQATIVYTVTAIVVANPNGNLVNTATIDGPPGFTDSDPSNNTSTDTDVLGPASDLSLSKSVSNSAPAVGSNITFTITATNIGPDPATGVEVTENLPSGFTFVSAAPSAGTTYTSATGLWTIGNMAVNETVTLTLTVTVNPTGSYVNTAEISASILIDPDSDPGNGDPTEDDQGTVTVVPDFGGGGGGGGGGNNPPANPTTPVVTGFLIPVTGFAPNKVTPLNVAAKPDYTATDLRIEIPSARVSTSIVGVGFKDGNWDVSWLQDQAGWLSGTAYPTWSGNSVVTAHSVNKDGKPGLFSNLKNLATGEYVFVYTDGYRYTYQVVSNRLLQPTDPSVLKHEAKSFLTLITCDTYDEGSGNYLLRTVVRAKLVDVSAVQ